MGSNKNKSGQCAVKKNIALRKGIIFAMNLKIQLAKITDTVNLSL